MKFIKNNAMKTIMHYKDHHITCLIVKKGTILIVKYTDKRTIYHQLNMKVRAS